ncbi:MAG: tryptophan synthase subunit alpha [Dehalococcoidia bacterium]|nr:tryptophan synthase subunit alpha [Dehalococcoidia bacterium]
MSRTQNAFGRPSCKALIPYVTVGYPSIEATLEVVPLLAESGGDLVELGIPFSDPLADGVTIQKASFQALQNGVTPATCLDVARQLAQKVKTPLVFMTYYNPILKYGHDSFCRDCSQAGIDGLIVPDLPPDEGQELEALCQKNGLDLVYIVAPTSTDERIRLAARHSRGFLYLASVAGVTGARDEMPAGLADFTARVRSATTLPLCVGFGISNARQASRVARIADGVIVGSRIVNLVGEGSTASLRSFIRELRSAIDQ